MAGPTTKLTVKVLYTRPTQFQRFTHYSTPPCQNTTRSIDIKLTVSAVTRDQYDTSNKLLTLSYIDDFYPHDTWTCIYTDGSATDTMQDGGAGSILYLPNEHTI